MTTTIDILVGRTGECSISVNGAQGKSCTKLTDMLEKAIGAPVGDRVFKPEYYVDGESVKLDIKQQ